MYVSDDAVETCHHTSGGDAAGRLSAGYFLTWRPAKPTSMRAPDTGNRHILRAGPRPQLDPTGAGLPQLVRVPIVTTLVGEK